MKYVEIYKLEDNGSQTVVVTCKLVDSSVVCEGPSTAIVDSISKNGIKNYEDMDGKRLFPKDGENFLLQLKFNFKSGYLKASDVLEG